LPHGIGSLWIRDRHKKKIPTATALSAEKGVVL